MIAFFYLQLALFDQSPAPLVLIASSYGGMEEEKDRECVRKMGEEDFKTGEKQAYSQWTYPLCLKVSVVGFSSNRRRYGG